MTLKARFSPFIKPLAYTLIAISTIAWMLVFIIPFLEFGIAEMAGMITALIIMGEVTFYIAILLMGKPLWEKIKHYWLHKILNQPKA
ncbi:transporter suffix domain-containing protein [Thiomicrorhabdus sp. Milos-T2]|uniref:transporter suffix domain-containing protein n=1 Tax=Thiomicrorhabdus sp. Milos-T2 TaxID=90814 RepID=UPI00068B97AD|nr:transporter suffix domain-containing protein [Thiomicrorhabdus sp. Milos-T2]